MTTEPKTKLDDLKDRTFGANHPTDARGEPLEKGHGSAYAAMSPAAKAHYHTMVASAAITDVLALAKQLAAAVVKLETAHKAAVDLTEAAVRVPQPPQAQPDRTADETKAKAEADARAAEVERQNRQRTAKENAAKAEAARETNP